MWFCGPIMNQSVCSVSGLRSRIFKRLKIIDHISLRLLQVIKCAVCHFPLTAVADLHFPPGNFLDQNANALVWKWTQC